ncbi:aldo/keto reductase [Salinibacter sp. 10B]|uniref:aldo/keto reductase n=1 Tax=Salinibacter sp. 10B TaxID=1923971 RepID=UPI000CF4F417|nr:aldo/keto reductase [Salinibacter sp. 10B]PQJ33572.1 aldo/keto reductase [Salinibacter sp. 10B]
MKYRPLGSTGWNVSAVSFGAWAIGGSWGSVDDHESLQALNTAVENGVNFFDTADVYGDGRSEQLLAQLYRDHTDIHVATKAGRRLDPHTAEGYNRENLTGFIDRSLENLDRDALDLVQLHCPPTEVYYQPEVFAVLDDLKAQGKIKHYGVSVEKVEEALKAIEYPGVETVQIIFNMFRQRPAQLFFEEAMARDVGIVARVPLASGLLTGKYGSDATFPETDHRHFNRNGEAFDVGETFAGVDLQQGVAAVRKLNEVKPNGMTMAQFALRWILMHDAVSCAIPGAKRPEQAAENAQAADLPPLSTETMNAVETIYDEYIRESVHHRW